MVDGGVDVLARDEVGWEELESPETKVEETGLEESEPGRELKVWQAAMEIEGEKLTYPSEDELKELGETVDAPSFLG